ncbi:MAG: hypothetical protein JNL11_01320 [Bdellovibrionaceae bacterium]|nr:hypothetical protein [Pseudobdellovibrionaceae bacterium]
MQLNRNGSALPAILMVAAILAVSSVGLLDLMRNLDTSAGNQVREERLQNMVKTLASTMEDVIDCTRILGGNAFNVSIPANEQAVVLKTSYGTDPIVPANYIQPGKNFGNGLVLSNVTIRAISTVNADMRFAYSATPIGSAAETIMTKYLAEIKFYPSGMNWNAEKSDRKIKLFIKVLNATNQIWSCHGTTSPAEACEIVLGGTYNPYMPDALAEYRCNPDRTCFVLKGPSNGLHITTTCPVPGLYQAQEIGSMSGVTHYLCNWCNIYR